MHQLEPFVAKYFWTTAATQIRPEKGDPWKQNGTSQARSVKAADLISNGKSPYHQRAMRTAPGRINAPLVEVGETNPNSPSGPGG
jgi:hypothetical protein